MAWLRGLGAIDRKVLGDLNEFVADHWPGAADEIKETSQGYTVTLENLPPEMDLGVLSDLVTRLKPRVSDVTVFWTGHSLTIGVDLVGAGKYGFIAAYSPLAEIPSRLADALTSSAEFDTRHTPANWEFVHGQLEVLVRVFVSRGSAISVPMTHLYVERDKPTWIEFENTEQISYSFLEYLCSRVHVTTILARADGQAILFEIGEGDLPPLLAKRE